MCVNIGHGDERVIKAMQEQAAEVAVWPPARHDDEDPRVGEQGPLLEITPQGALSKMLFHAWRCRMRMRMPSSWARGYTKRHKKFCAVSPRITGAECGRNGRSQGDPRPPVAMGTEHLK